MSNIKKHLLVLLLYFGICIIYTYPFVLNFTKQVVGRGGDVYQILADTRSNFEVLKNLGYFESLWFTLSHLRLDPISINTYFQFLFGQPVGYNLFWLFSFIAAGFGVYLLVKYIFDNLGYKGFAASASAFIAGFIYSFSPAHFAWGMGFRGATHIEWIPFTTLFFIKFIKKPSAKYFLWLGFFFLLLIMGESHFAAYYFIFLIPFLTYYLSQNKQVFKNKLFRRYTLLTIVLGALIVIIIYLPLIKISISEKNFLDPGIEQATKYSPDVLSIITPSGFHPIWSEFFAPIREAFTGNATTHSNYLGLIAIILFIFSFFYARRAKIKEIYFWSFSALGFFILSLGPFLHYLGTIEPKIPLPYLLLHRYAPFFDNIRAVGRFWVIALLCFSVAIAFGLKYLFDRLPKKKTGLTITLSAVTLLMISLEYLAIPIPFSSLEYSPFYDQLRKEAGNFYIADIPGSVNYEADAKTRYYASIHQKKLISGLDPARKVPGSWDLQINTPVLSEILYTLPKGKKPPTDIINHNYSNLANKIFSYLNIPYIIIQKEFAGDEGKDVGPHDYEVLRDFITGNFDIEKVYDDAYIIAYKVKSVEPKDFLYLTIGDGWEIQNTEKNNRQINDEASLIVHNFYSTAINLSLDMVMRSPYNKFRTTSFYLNDELIGNYFSYTDLAPFHLNIPDIPPGENVLKIKISDYGLTSNTPVAIENISYAVANKRAMLDDFHPLEKHSDAKVAFTPLRSSYYFQDVGVKKATIYGHPVLTPEDLITEDRRGKRTWLLKLPLMNELFAVDQENYPELETYRDIREAQYYADNIANIIADYNLGYIYADKKSLNKQERKGLSRYLNKYLPNLDVIGGKRFTIYKVNPAVRNKSVPFFFGYGWDILENKFGQSKRRKIYDSAYLQLYSQAEQKIRLAFKARTCPATTTYGSIDINGEQNKNFTVQGDGFREVILTTDRPLDTGLNQLTIFLSDDQKQIAQEAAKCPIWISDISIYGVE